MRNPERQLVGVLLTLACCVAPGCVRMGYSGAAADAAGDLSGNGGDGRIDTSGAIDLAPGPDADHHDHTALPDLHHDHAAVPDLHHDHGAVPDLPAKVPDAKPPAPDASVKVVTSANDTCATAAVVDAKQLVSPLAILVNTAGAKSDHPIAPFCTQPEVFLKLLNLPGGTLAGDCIGSGALSYSYGATCPPSNNCQGGTCGSPALDKWPTGTAYVALYRDSTKGSVTFTLK